MSIYYLPPFLASFSGISGEARTASRRIIRRLALLFHGIPHHSVPMPPLHNSFVAFLADSECSGAFSISMQVAHEEVARACFKIMENLRFNICSFPSSFTANADIADLDSIIREAIPSQLSYACRHWTYHASQLKSHQNEAAASISRFFQNHFLHWLEVMGAYGDSPFRALVLLRPFQVFTLRVICAQEPNHLASDKRRLPGACFHNQRCNSVRRRFCSPHIPEYSPYLPERARSRTPIIGSASELP